MKKIFIVLLCAVSFVLGSRITVLYATIEIQSKNTAVFHSLGLSDSFYWES